MFTWGVGTIIELHTLEFDRKPTKMDMYDYKVCIKALRHKKP